MATVRKWSNVAVAMQSALGADKTISAIAVGATATVTATHDFSAGDYVVFNVQGMHQLNGRCFRVLSVSTTVSFVIEGTGAASLDTSSFSAFTSGTCNKVTFGTSITSAMRSRSDSSVSRNGLRRHCATAPSQPAREKMKVIAGSSPSRSRVAMTSGRDGGR